MVQWLYTSTRKMSSMPLRKNDIYGTNIRTWVHNEAAAAHQARAGRQAAQGHPKIDHIPEKTIYPIPDRAVIL